MLNIRHLLKRILSFVFCLTLVLLSTDQAKAQLADSPWPTYKGNSQHTGQSPYDTSQTKPQEKWRFTTEGGVESSVTIGPDGTLYVGGFHNHFYALTPDGSEKWRFTEPRGWFRSTASIAKDGTIYIGTVIDNKKDPSGKKKYEYGKPIIYALNPDGSKKWEFSAGGSYDGMYISPTIASDGTIYAVSGSEFEPTDDGKGGKLWALNPDGTIKWDFDPRQDSARHPGTICTFFTTPALAKDGTIYAAASCGDKGKVFAVTPDGIEKWFFSSQKYFDGTPTVGSDGTIYVGSADKNLYALNPEGKEKWRFATQDIIEASPSIGSDGTIYVGTVSHSKDYHLYALNPDGTEKWRFKTDNGVEASPAIGKDGTIYFGSYDNNLYALNPEGKEKWRFTVGGGIVVPPTIDKDGTIYFGSWDHNLYAIGGSSIKQDLTEKVRGLFENRKMTFFYVVIVTLALLLMTIGTIMAIRKKA